MVYFHCRLPSEGLFRTGTWFEGIGRMEGWKRGRVVGHQHQDFQACIGHIFDFSNKNALFFIIYDIFFIFCTQRGEKNGL